MRRLFQIAERGLSGLASIWTFVAPAVPGTVGAIVSGYIASTTGWISGYGAWGWWCAALVGGLLATIMYLLVAIAKERLAHAAAIKKWASEVDTIDPMAQTYDQKRIDLADLAHPVTGKIERKVFTNCDLLGPLNLAFLDQVSMNGVGLCDCDIIVVKDRASLSNVKALTNCSLIGGRMFNCSIFVPQDFWNVMKDQMPGAVTITYERP